jgi:hypothetical protein
VEQIFSEAPLLQAVDIPDRASQEDDRGWTTGDDLFCRWTKTIREDAERQISVQTLNVNLTTASEYYRQDVTISEAAYMKLLYSASWTI